jgi:hypothetical protein
MNVNVDEAGGDLLFGAEEISSFLFASPDHRRRVYHLAEKHDLPTFRIGSSLCARRGSLRRWLDDREDGERQRGPRMRGP